VAAVATVPPLRTTAWSRFADDCAVLFNPVTGEFTVDGVNNVPAPAVLRAAVKPEPETISPEIRLFAVPSLIEKGAPVVVADLVD
jgi:hypothetical protein